jgi:hypothetical protein
VAVRLTRGVERTAMLGLTLLAFALRVAALGAKGLAYDEAATALMARAAPAEIVRFHWSAGFEHPPLWQLLVYAWSALAGQSEAALRFLPALAGTLGIPLLWLAVGLAWPQERGARVLAAGLAAVAPVLVLYGQEARMYTLVVALALGGTAAALLIAERWSRRRATAFALLGWLMLWTHYYTLLPLAVLGAWGAWRAWRDGKGVLRWALLWAATVLPLALWMAFSPGFHTTLDVVFQPGSAEHPPPALFLDGLWRDLSFGAFRVQPPQAWLGYLLLPLALAGMAVGWRKPPGGWLFAALIAVPVAASALAFGALATRYILYVLPPLLACAALAVAALGRWNVLAGALALGLALLPAGAGLAHYFGGYEKSAYREMAAALQARAGDDDLVLLYAPRQHLLYKYYVARNLAWAPVPGVTMPDFWPVTAPPVVPDETDGQVQAALQEHPAVWLVATAENEVDLGEFVPKYLRAVAYRDYCLEWSDVRLCRFRSPASVATVSEWPLTAEFGAGFYLDGAAVGETAGAPPGARFLPVRLDWRIDDPPAADLKVSVRLVDASGAVVAQTDDYPIGPLLPPTTWQPGDAKPGYFVLELAPDVAPGEYTLAVQVYDAASGAPVGGVDVGTVAIR